MDYPKSVPNVGLVNGKFVDENTTTGIVGSLIPAAWGSAVTDEILNVIQAAGLLPNEADLGQLLKAIRKLAQSNKSIFALDSGGSNAYAASFSPEITSVSDGMVIGFKAKSANNGASTFSANGLAAAPIVGGSYSPLQGGEIALGGDVWLQWDSAVGEGAWVILHSAGGSVQIAAASRSRHAVNAYQVQKQELTAFTATGESPTLVLSPVPAITGYETDQRFRVKFNVNSGGAQNTLNISGRGAKKVKQYDGLGGKVAAVFWKDQLADVEYDGTDLVILTSSTVGSATTASPGTMALANTQEVLDGSIFNKAVVPGTLEYKLITLDKWMMQPIGVPIPVFDNIAGVVLPSQSRSDYRYVKLSASDAYNNGILVSESITGTGALVQASAIINLDGSPLNGRSVQLINTERRSLRAGASGTLENDQFQGHTFGDGTNIMKAAPSGVSSGGEFLRLTAGGGLVVMSDGANGVPRSGSETRPKNIGVTYFMRIK